MTGLDFVRGLASGDSPLNPMAQVLGYDIVEAEAGRVSVAAEPRGAPRWPEGVRPLHVETPAAAQLDLLQDLAHRLTAEHIRLRFAGMRRLESPDEIAEAFQCGRPGHEMVWAIERDSALVGVANYVGVCKSRLAVALVVRPDRMRRGIGLALLEDIKRRGRLRGFANLCGTILWENRPMRALARKAGFSSVGVGGLFTDVELSLS